jgi:DNA polymerase-3 subunit delta'
LTVGCPEGKRELPIALIAGEGERRGREGLLHDLSLRPMSATRRIAIIDDADTMNEESANALLKTLEEPPPGSLLFLISPSLDALLPTIRSRCQPLHFGPLAEQDIAELIVELGWEADVEAAAAVAALAEGSLTTARQLLDPGLRKLRDELHARLAAAEFQSLQTADALIAVIEELGSDTPAQREIAAWVIRFAVGWYRDQLTAVASGREPPSPGWPALLARCCGDWKEAADRLAASIDRCVQADAQLAQMMPVPLCLEGLCDGLSRIQRGEVVLMV